MSSHNQSDHDSGRELLHESGVPMSEIKDSNDIPVKFEDTYASNKTIRKEYEDLASMLKKSIAAMEDENDLKKTALQRKGLFSKLNFGWVYPAISRMYAGAMAPENLELTESEKSDTNYLRFKNNWQTEIDEHGIEGASLNRAIRKTFWNIFLKATILKLIWGLVLVFTMGISIRQLILFVANKQRETWTGYVTAVSFLISSLLLGFLLHHMTSWSVRLGIALRSSLNRAIFDKAMTSKQTSSSVGEVLSLISRDAATLSQAAKAIQYLWSGPLEVAGLTGFCAYYVGLPSVWILILCAVTVPAQFVMGLSITSIRENNILSNTERLLIIHEILYSIKLVKFYTWEDSFSKKIQNLREKELKDLRKAAWIKAFNLGLVFLFPPLAAVGCFYWMVQNGTKLVPAITFTILTLCNSLRFPLVMLPSAIKIVNDATKGLKRIEEFLKSQDRVPVAEAKEVGVFLNNASFGFDDEKDEKEEQLMQVKLSGVTLSLRPGDVMAVVGQCGSGKSTLLRGLLGEADIVSGTVAVKGRIAYVPQNPFIMHGSVRDNITFGLPYEEEWYLQVLRACCLPSDLNTFSHGDLTYLSEGGINLSGGQRQRVALARAMYAKADIYLLDSVLSALDPATGRKCFRRCVQKLLKNAVVILVTHSIDTLPQCNVNMILNDGKVLYTGPFDESQVLKVFPPSMLKSVAKSVEDLDVNENNLQDAFKLGRNDSINAKNVLGEKMEEEELNIPVVAQTFSAEPKASKGAIAWIREYGNFMFIFTLALFLTTQIVRIFSDFWVRYWVNDKYNQSANWYVARYGIIISIFGSLLLIRGVIFYIQSLKAAKSFNTKLYKAIVEAPILFFTKEPLGKILKSFSHDQDAVDDSLPDTAHVTMIFFSISLTTTVLVCMVIPWITIAAAAVLIGWFLIQRFVSKASNSLKTAVAETNSAAVVHASESMHGISVIRAFGQERFMQTENEVLVDSNISAVFYLEHVELWAELHIDMIAALFVFMTALLIVIQRDTIKAGDAGLAISNATQLLVFLAMMVQGFGDVFFQMYSTARIDEYIQKTPAEDFSGNTPLPQVDGKPTFPAGEVDFKKIYVSYDITKGMVLNDISLSVKGGERIGIVGRTGSGKTSLLNTLFRLMELVKGNISVDGYNVRKVPLKQLREALCIIPQEPVLFKGTFRSNLDPFNEYTDEELWRALELSYMKDYVANSSKQLATEIVEGGQNISIGQKQLLCLARIILKKNCRILVLDEATSALDPHTDQLIQQAIRDVFKTQTILTIAHRLDTIKDYDKILVLHFGELVEFDTVDNLLSKEHGYFKALYESHKEAEN